MITSSDFPAGPPWLWKMSTEDIEQKKSYPSINSCHGRNRQLILHLQYQLLTLSFQLHCFLEQPYEGMV